MAREENSLLFSLKEVANTLQDRLKEEEDSRLASAEAERRAKEDAIRRAKEEEEAKVRAAEDAIRREREAKEHKEREDRIRLEEAERRARIEAEARIEEANLRAATEAIKSKPLPVKLIAAVSAVFIMIIGLLGPTELASTNIAFNLNTLAFIPVLGMSIAVSTLVGQRIGEKRPEIAANSSLMLYSYFQTLTDQDVWDEGALQKRARGLLPLAIQLWPCPASIP